MFAMCASQWHECRRTFLFLKIPTTIIQKTRDWLANWVRVENSHWQWVIGCWWFWAFKMWILSVVSDAELFMTFSVERAVCFVACNVCSVFLVLHIIASYVQFAVVVVQLVFWSCSLCVDINFIVTCSLFCDLLQNKFHPSCLFAATVVNSVSFQHTRLSWCLVYPLSAVLWRCWIGDLWNPVPQIAEGWISLNKSKSSVFNLIRYKESTWRRYSMNGSAHRWRYIRHCRRELSDKVLPLTGCLQLWKTQGFFKF